MRTATYFFGLLLTALLGTQIASAHVTVKPSEVKAATFTTFTVSVPSEKEGGTAQIRLVIPGGLTNVTPTVKPGWIIAVKKEGTGEGALITEITWSGGLIPTDQRDEFSLSAKTPVDEQTLAWKAYQAYTDGSIVSWDQVPNQATDSQDETNEPTPYSETAVQDAVTTSTADTNARNLAASALGVAILSLILPFTIRRK